MNNKKRIIRNIAIVITVIVICLTIVYDPVTKYLKIRQSKHDIKWDIHFDNLSKPIITGSAKVKVSPKLFATHIGNFIVLLNNPGDSVAYEFDIVNDGNIDAIVRYYTNNNNLCYSDYRFNHCDWNGNGYDDNEDLKMINNNITYTLRYIDSNKNLNIGDELKRKSKKRVILKIEYNKDSNQLPKNKIVLNGLDKIINYIQK